MHPRQLVDLPTPSASEQLRSSPSAPCDKAGIVPPSPSPPVALETKSPEELRALVQEAYATLRNKEKDIKTAAEVGWSLLENNLELKARHETLQKSTHVNTRTSSPELDMKPSTSILTRSNSAHATASRLLQRVDSTDSNSSHGTTTMRLISREQADDAIVRMLTEKNSEIQGMLDSTLARHEASRQADLERTLRLEREMSQLQAKLDQAAHTIERLEHEREKKPADAVAAEEHKSSGSGSSAPYDDHMLKTRLAQLQEEHKRLLAGKATTQNKLDRAAWDLRQWQSQIADLESIDRKYRVQQQAFAQQANDIARLTGTLEDYRTQMVAGSSSQDGHSTRSRDNGSAKSNQPVMAPSKSLLNELERTWAKERKDPHPPPPLTTASHQTSQRKTSVHEPPRIATSSPIHALFESPTSPSSSSTSSSSSSSSSSGEGGMVLPSPSCSSASPLPSPSRPMYGSSLLLQSLPPATNSMVAASEVGGGGGGASTYTIPPSLYANLSVSCSRRPLIPTPPIRRFRRRSAASPSTAAAAPYPILLWLPLLVIGKLWAWYRFSLIVFLAILINLWHGPDAILEKSS